MRKPFGIVDGLGFRIVLDVLFHGYDEVSELQNITRPHCFRRRETGSIEKRAVGRIEVFDLVVPLLGLREFRMVSRDIVALDTQVVVVHAPDAMGAITENDFIGVRIDLRFDYEFQDHRGVVGAVSCLQSDSTQLW